MNKVHKFHNMYYVCRIEDDIPWIESSNFLNIEYARVALQSHRTKYPKDKFAILQIEETRTLLDE